MFQFNGQFITMPLNSMETAYGPYALQAIWELINAINVPCEPYASNISDQARDGIVQRNCDTLMSMPSYNWDSLVYLRS